MVFKTKLRDHCFAQTGKMDILFCGAIQADGSVYLEEENNTLPTVRRGSDSTDALGLLFILRQRKPVAFPGQGGFNQVSGNPGRKRHTICMDGYRDPFQISLGSYVSIPSQSSRHFNFSSLS